MYYSQRYISSSSFYKLTRKKQIDAGNQFMRNKLERRRTSSYYYRMPETEFNVLYRMRSAFLEGYFDHNKEVLIPHKQNNIEGYKVFTPFYYYLAEGVDIKNPVTVDDKNITMNPSIVRCAMAVDRGW